MERSAPHSRNVCAFLRQPPEQLFNMLLTTHAIHARRRAGEMEGVLALLAEAGIDGRMTEATMQKLAWSADLGLVDEFDGEIPIRMEAVLQVIQAKLYGFPLPYWCASLSAYPAGAYVSLVGDRSK